MEFSAEILMDNILFPDLFKSTRLTLQAHLYERNTETAKIDEVRFPDLGTEAPVNLPSGDSKVIKHSGKSRSISMSQMGPPLDRLVFSK